MQHISPKLALSPGPFPFPAFNVACWSGTGDEAAPKKQPWLLPYSLKFFKVENFCGSDNGRKKFLPRNFKFMTDARWGWKLDDKDVIRESLFLSRIWQKREMFYPRKFWGLSDAAVDNLPLSMDAKLLYIIRSALLYQTFMSGRSSKKRNTPC